MYTYIKSNKTTIIFSVLFILFAFLVATQFVTAQDEEGMEMSQKHKSKVTNVVQELREIAGKDQVVGEEIRVVAQEQEQSNERAIKAIENIETRGGFKTFLIGTDYKNIGALLHLMLQLCPSPLLTD